MPYSSNDQMLLSSVYNLNAQYTKQISVGVVYHINKNPFILVQLRGSHPKSVICLIPESWNLLKLHFNQIKLFFDGQENQQKIDCGNYCLYLTNSFGERVVILEQEEEKIFHRYLLHASTFHVLEKISSCIDEHINGLLFLPLKYAKDCIVTAITEDVYLKIKAPNAKDIELYVKDNYHSLTEKAFKKVIFFNKTHFQILFIELVTFEIKLLCHEILNMLSNKN